MKRVIIVAALAFVAGCDQTPHPLTPVGELVCGYTSHPCREGGCCLNEEVCRPPVAEYPNGYCAYASGPSSTWGNKRPQRPAKGPK